MDKWGANFTKPGSSAPPEAPIFDKMTATHPSDQFWGVRAREHREREQVSRLHIDKKMSQPAGCTPSRPENRPGEASEPATPLCIRKRE